MQPVDGLESTRHDTDTSGSTNDTHGSRYGNTELRSKNDGDGSSEFHRETSRWRVESDFVTEGDHHVVTISSETNDDHGTTESQHPDGSLGATVGRETSVPDEVDCGERTDSVGDIVGTVSESLGT